jgi:replicative DNA helicase
MPNRVPPHNLDAERQLLSAFMIQPFDTAKACAGIVKSADFYKPAHSHIFESIEETIDSGARPDPVVLLEDLRRKGLLEACGGAPGIVEATTTMDGFASNAPRYVEIISGHARNRDLIAAAGAIAEAAYEGGEAAHAAAEALRLVQEVVDATNRRVHLRSMDEMIDSYVAVLEAREQGEGLGISTGYHELDALIEGMRGGQLIFFGAPPKVGKTTLGLNLVRNVLHEGHAVLLASVEMSETEDMERIVAAEGRVDLSRLRRGDLRLEDWERISRASARLSGKPLWILDDPNCTLAEVRAAALRTSAELVVIDYVQLMRAEVKKGGTREQVVAELTAGMKRMARELDIPVVALSQVKREAADGRPGLTDFAESSSFEKNADYLCGLYRSEEDPATLEVIVIAARHGKPGTARLAYLGHHQVIANMAQMDAPRQRYN